jgi:1-aminocyclopropane-1-carboxylate deaminase/D-cysteine desulfhydrase-like pyridoxal-dependent ACC family enzyme
VAVTAPASPVPVRAEARASASGPLPRVGLCALPTPLVEAPRLARALGLRSLHVKRDDLTGFAVAGNKARKLELLLAEAVARGCDVLLTGGGAGSNFCAAAAAAARVAGLACELVLYGAEPAPPAAGPVNLALARAWGGDVRFTGQGDRASVDRALPAVAAALEAEGRRVYTVPRGGATPLGALAYALAARELAAQVDRLGLRDPLVVVATGSGGTQAGLVAGAAADGLPFRVVGASVSRPVQECCSRVAALAAGCSALLHAAPAPPGAVRVVDARGPGYGVASEAGSRAASLAAQTEGLLLDHVFTAKALAVAASVADRETDVVFVHTGGLATSLAALAESPPREEAERGRA